MDAIPAVFWMIILSFLTFFSCLILYYIAMLFKETSQTVAEVKDIVKQSKGIIKNVEKILEESSEIIGSVKRTTLAIEGTVDEVKKHVIEPVKKIGSIFSMIAGIFDKFRK